MTESLKKLQLDYVDLVLLHTPGIPARNLEDPSNPKPQDEKKNKELRKSGWLALEKFYSEGKTKAIGVSNYWPQHIKEVLECGTVKPHINQIEYNPWNQRPVQVMFCRENDIVVEGWGPFAKNQKLEDAALKKIGEKKLMLINSNKKELRTLLK